MGTAIDLFQPKIEVEASGLTILLTLRYWTPRQIIDQAKAEEAQAKALQADLEAGFVSVASQTIQALRAIPADTSTEVPTTPAVDADGEPINHSGPSPLDQAISGVIEMAQTALDNVRGGVTMQLSSITRDRLSMEALVDEIVARVVSWNLVYPHADDEPEVTIPITKDALMDLPMIPVYRKIIQAIRKDDYSGEV